MKTLYIDCQMGAAGDMLMGALLELVPDRKKFLEKLNQAGIPGVRIEAQKSVKCGITGTHMEVLVNGEEEDTVYIATDIFTDMTTICIRKIMNTNMSTHIIICFRKKP